MSPAVIAALGLGSNLEAPGDQIRSALHALAAVPGVELRAISSLYLSPPLGPQDQPDYVNAVALVSTTLRPHALLDVLQAVEHAHHRVRERHWGPRTLDLDLLTYGAAQLHDERLTIPHPGLAERAFVVVPLAEIAPELEIPGLPRPCEMLPCFADSAVRRLGPA